MNPAKCLKPFSIILISLFLLNSCFGFNVDITLNQNGSGTLTLEYLIARSIESLGRLDGNERWNTIPVGRSDFQRSIDRLPEMKLLSFSSRENEKNLVSNVKMEFKNLPGLMAFLDSGGLRSSFSGDARSGSIFMTLSEGAISRGQRDPDLQKLITGVSESYRVKISMSFPNEGALVITNNRGSVLTPPALLEQIPGCEITNSGKKVSCSFPLDAILSSTEGINIALRW